KDHWAMYACPERIPIVYEPVAGGPGTTSTPDRADKKRSAGDVLQTIVIRVPPRCFQTIDIADVSVTGLVNPNEPIGIQDGDTKNLPITLTGTWYYNVASSGDSKGGYLRGTADVTRAQGTLMLEQGQARLLREQAIQARLETKKKALETELWIKANTAVADA